MALTPQEELELVAIERERRKRSALPAQRRETPMDLMRERGGFAPAQSPIARKAEQSGAAALSRYGVPMLQPQGGPTGALAAGAGESLAQIIEGTDDNAARVKASAMGAVPLQGAAKGITGALKAAGKMGGASVIGDAVGALLGEGQDVDAATRNAGLVAGVTAAMPLVGRLLGKATGNVSPEEMARVKDLMDNEATRTAREQIKQARQYELVTPSGESRRLMVDPTIPAVQSEDDKILKFLGGKAALNQVAAKKNVPVFQGMTQQDMGLPQTGGGISDAQYKAAYEPFYEPYNKIKQIRSQAIDQLKKLEDEVLGKADGLSAAQAARRAELEADPEFQRMAKPLRIQAAADVDALRKARGDASMAMKRYTSSEGKDTMALEDYKKLKEAADAMEVKIDDAARLSDDPAMLEKLAKARAGIARLHDYGDALGLDGMIDPQVMRLKAEAGVPLSGNAKTIAEFALNARNNAIQLSRIGDPNSNAMGGMLATGGALSNPQTGLFALGVPGARDWARNRLISEAKQPGLLNPAGARTSADPRTTEIITRLAAILAAQKENQ